MPEFARTFHILGRYPELARDRDFLTWIRTYGGEVWHETPATEDNYVTVVVQSDNRLNLFAALLKRNTSDLKRGIIANEVVKTASIDLTEQRLAPQTAVNMVRSESGVSSTQIHALRPVVDWRTDQPQVGWEVEVVDGGAVRTFNVDRADNVTHLAVREVKKLSTCHREMSPSRLQMTGSVRTNVTTYQHGVKPRKRWPAPLPLPKIGPLPFG